MSDPTRLGAKLWGWLDADHPDPLATAPKVDGWLAGMLGLPELTRTPPSPLDPAKVRETRLTAEMVAALEAAVGGGVSLDPAVRAHRTVGQSYPDQLERRAGKVRDVVDAVAFPENAVEAGRLLDAAGQHGFRVTPAGGGTSVVGGFDAPRDKRPLVVADTTHLDRVEIAAADGTVTAGAGVRLDRLDEVLSHSNVTIGHYPQSFHGATVGGAIAANGSGQRSDLYGRIADRLVSARMATPSGLWSTEAFREASAGPWLGGLVAGSEGLFGILTDATLRLQAAPEHVEDRAWLAPSFEAGLRAARDLAQAGHGLAMMRVSDEAETAFLTGFRLARAGADVPPLLERTLLLVKRAPRRPALVIAGYEGSNQGTGRAFAQASGALRKAGATSLGSRPGASWRKSRYDLPHLRESLMARGLGVDTFETAASWSKLPALHAAVRAAITDAVGGTLEGTGHAAVLCHAGHAYPEGACLYFTAIFPRAVDALEQWRAIKKAATQAIVANGGALSHHHGLGADHAPWLKDEKGAIGVALLTALARTLDPRRIMSVGASRALDD